ncbi:PorP/SprF family type IX secretion system membrane protein [Aquimarina agarilytica]|uniref:PorP/SprF family type IX secretion system membrane protein n=1 Tax=Aquimarina agarilytica TaxID=1087449 RepID=UPI0002891C0D|nr:type IX secretion system membrane protein PorP/SprF [Aquimarina agarilytica]
MKVHYKLFFLLFLLFSIGGFSQQDAQYTQYTYNTVAINPAYAGTRGTLNVIGLHRSQWVGLEGAPRTQTLAIHSPIGVGRVGLGGSVINDVVGPAQETYFNVDFSYTIPTSAVGKLTFGLKAGGRLFNVDFNKLNQFNTDDAIFNTNIDGQFSPVVGIGGYYHTKKVYIGLSAPNLLQTNHFDTTNATSIASSSFVAKERLNYYLIAGYVMDLNDNIKFKPSLLTKLVFGAPLQVDVSANFLFNEKFTAGLAYRWSAAVSGLVAFQVSNSMLIGFSYDRDTTELQEKNDGSFELFLRFELFKKYNRLVTPRFF